MNTEENRNARRDKKGKASFIRHSGVGGFPAEVWKQRKAEDPLTVAKKCRRCKK